MLFHHAVMESVKGTRWGSELTCIDVLLSFITLTAYSLRKRQTCSSHTDSVMYLVTKIFLSI